MSATDQKNSLPAGFSFGTSSAQGQFKVAVFPRMAEARKEQSFTGVYRGLTLTLTYQPDENGFNPTDDDLPFPVNEERRSAWEKGEWWYFNAMVHTYDSKGIELDISRVACAECCTALPSFMDHSYRLQQMCDEVVDTLLMAYAETRSHDLGVQDQIYEDVSENTDGAMDGFKKWLDAENNVEGLGLDQASQS